LILAADLHHQRDVLLRRRRLDDEEGQLGGNRLELNLVDRIVDQRGHRNGRFGVP
jgi:hypothetical protein